MPSDTFVHSTSISASPATVLAALHEAETWKGIGPIDEVWDAVHDEAGLSSFRWTARAAGRSWEGTANRLPDPGAAMALALESSEVGGEISVTVATNGNDTTLTVELTARSKGFLSGMFWSVIADALRSGLPAQVEQFGSRF